VPPLGRFSFDVTLQNRRAAAEALGRIGDPSAIPALLTAIGKLGASAPGSNSDRVLEHSLTFALIEIGDAKTVAAGLNDVNARTRRAALTALDQIKDGGLTPEIVAKELESTDPRLKETAWWIASRHPEWGNALADALRQRLDAPEGAKDEREELTRLLARFARAPAVQQFLAERLRDPKATRPAQEIVFHAMARSGLKEAPPAWTDAITQVLTNGDPEMCAMTASTARSLRFPKQRPEAMIAQLLRLAENADMPAAVRLDALAAVPGGLPKVDGPLFAFLRSQLNGDLPASTRSLAAEVLAHAHLTTDQLVELAQALKTVGPLELDRLMEAFGQSHEEKVGQELVAALKSSSARSSLRAERVKPLLAKYPSPVQASAQELYAALEADNAQQYAKLEQLLASVKKGDIRRGQAVFNGTKASCSACHAIGYLGGNVGPDLTNIGKIRSERDLLESIVFPSASFVRSYEPVLVTLKDGKAHNGLIRQDGPDEILLATGINQEVRIARKDIDEIQPSKVSIMPAGLDQQLSGQELADLIVFLKACQ